MERSGVEWGEVVFPQFLMDIKRVPRSLRNRDLNADGLSLESVLFTLHLEGFL